MRHPLARAIRVRPELPYVRDSLESGSEQSVKVTIEYRTPGADKGSFEANVRHYSRGLSGDGAERPTDRAIQFFHFETQDPSLEPASPEGQSPIPLVAGFLVMHHVALVEISMGGLGSEALGAA